MQPANQNLFWNFIAIFVVNTLLRLKIEQYDLPVWIDGFKRSKMDYQTLQKIATLLALQTDFEQFLLEHKKHQEQPGWIKQAQKLSQKMNQLDLVINQADVLLNELKQYFPLAQVNFQQPPAVLELLDEIVLWLQDKPKFCGQLNTWLLSSILNFNQDEDHKLANLEKWFKHLKIFFNMSLN